MMERARQEGERDREQQLLKQQLFEKYGTNNPRNASKDQQSSGDLEEGAAVLRLG